MSDPHSDELLARYAGGEESAATALFERYVQRLTALARGRLAPALRRRVDAEDVVLSAYRSFFVRARGGEFTLRRSGDLWRLLVAITLRKAYRNAERHGAGKRDSAREAPLVDDALARGPSPEEAAAAADELQHALAPLTPAQRRAVELRLQGYRLDEIAAEIGSSERTVRRALEAVRGQLQRRLEGGA